MAAEAGTMASVWSTTASAPSLPSKPLESRGPRRGKPSRGTPGSNRGTHRKRAKGKEDVPSITSNLDDIPESSTPLNPTRGPGPQEGSAPTNGTSNVATPSEANPANPVTSSNPRTSQRKGRNRTFSKKVQHALLSPSNAFRGPQLDTKVESESLSSSSASLPVTPTLAPAVPHAMPGGEPKVTVTDAGEPSPTAIVVSPKHVPQALTVADEGVRPNTPSTHSHLNWADDDEEELPDLDEWNVQPARPVPRRRSSATKSLNSPAPPTKQSLSTEATGSVQIPVLEIVTAQVDSLSSILPRLHQSRVFRSRGKGKGIPPESPRGSSQGTQGRKREGFGRELLLLSVLQTMLRRPKKL
ncbi:uncharacterized protein EI90DRAFT_2467791 [Cantharellus anzutake]|uniref:uncharacterized protein n=1 Tax=Cantharellus anzutake TaxID=1750568 RepID=UPI001907A2FD|nr:uncharacterized protein EI90DRAFT_2467791 [Cantharellus anzutake]KAF8339173.1 hypothetical protein EI90DRAFT_2467791 [Cantharellus anzutake]